MTQTAADIRRVVYVRENLGASAAFNALMHLLYSHPAMAGDLRRRIDFSMSLPVRRG